MKITRENIAKCAECLVNYQLGMIGKSIKEAQTTTEWYSKWTMTQEQHNELKAYSLPLIKKVFKCTKERAERTFQWFDLQFGLRVSDK